MKTEIGIISPSQVNMFISCPEKWYSAYVLEIPRSSNFYADRGTLVHSFCETIGKGFPPKTSAGSADEIISWAKHRGSLLIENEWPTLQGKYKEADDKAKQETLLMANNFVDMVERRMRYHTIKSNPSWAWKSALPKYSELSLKDEDIGLRGKIDAIIEKEEGADKYLVLTDYKTSKVYKSMVSGEYYRQGVLYALLVNNVLDMKIDFIATDFLSHGETIAYPVRSADLAEAAEMLKNVRVKMEIAISTPHDKIERRVSRLCQYCDFEAACMKDGYIKTEEVK